MRGTREVRKFRTSRISDPTHQFKHRNFRPCAEPDREASNANAAVHIELLATVFLQASDVRYPHQTAEVEPAVDEIERQLAAAMNVAGQRQVDAQLGLIEALRVVDQQNINCVRHYQRFELL